jgi:RHS repeat-associated protein
VLVTVGPAPSGENTKRRQLEYDSLGRLTSVCEVTSATGSGRCVQNSTVTGYWTRYKYNALGNLIGVCENTTQPTNVDCITNPSSGQQTRSYTYDDLSRMTSETNPESGPTTHVYDSTGPSPCYSANYTSNGDLVRKADGEGRPSTVSASSGQNPVTGTIYNPYGTPPQTTVNFGSGDSDVFNFDSNTGRMLQYKFNVGSQAVVGQLNWNPLGTLGSLAITDPFNNANAQTCNYVHDDLSRIGGSLTVPGVNCVNVSQQTVWSNTFTFDAFGNINKAGTSSFGATYSPATNRMTTIGTSTPSYDADGNVLNDFLHTHTWNADGRPLTIDTVGVTYDALGRMVEHNWSGTYYEIAYAPSGEKLANMYGQTLSWGFIPLPGGAKALYTSSGLDYYRHPDWLGSVRLTTTPSRTIYGDVAYGPYGEAYAQSGSTDLVFTGQDQASTSNEYDFPAREYGIQGRWPSPDPAGLGAVDPSDPQSWNRYAYVLNTPLNAVDPTGMDCVWVNGGAVCTVNGTPTGGDPTGGNSGGSGWGGGGGSGWGGGGGLPYNCQYSPACLCHWRGNCQFVFRPKPKPPTPTSNNAPPWYKNACITGAIGNGLLHAGIDAIGLIPEGWLVSRAIGNAFNYRGIVADQLGNKVLGAVSMGAGISSTGLGANNTSTVGSIQTGLGVAGIVSTLAGATPVLGQVFSGLSVAADVINAGMAIAKCN